MNRRTYIWKVGGLAVVMVAVVVWLFGCSRESIEEGMEGGTLSAPMILVASSLDGLEDYIETTIIVYENSTPVGSYYIRLVSPELDANNNIPPSREWCYYVEELPGSRSLSHWVFAVQCLVEPDNHIVDTDPDATEIGYDGSTGYTGVKWDLPEGFTLGTFCITLDGEYDATIIDVVVKTGAEAHAGFATGSIVGPVCIPIQHNGNGQGNGE